MNLKSLDKYIKINVKTSLKDSKKFVKFMAYLPLNDWAVAYGDYKSIVSPNIPAWKMIIFPSLLCSSIILAPGHRDRQQPIRRGTPGPGGRCRAVDA
jgi:hypothetical protein